MLNNIRNGPLIIRIRIGSDIGIHRSVLRALGYPENILFWWSETSKALLLSAVGKTSNMAVPIPNRYYKTGNGFVFGNKQLLAILMKLTGWKNGSKNKIIGEFVPEVNMVVFRLSGAKKNV